MTESVEPVWNQVKSQIYTLVTNLVTYLPRTKIYDECWGIVWHQITEPVRHLVESQIEADIDA